MLYLYIYWGLFPATSCKPTDSCFPSEPSGEIASFTRNLTVLLRNSLVCTHSPCPVCWASLLACSLNYTPMLSCTPCSTCGCHQQLLAIRRRELPSHDTAYRTHTAMYILSMYVLMYVQPRCEKPCLRGFRPDTTQTGLYIHSRWLET